MKKNRTMRAAALLLALTLMTSCFVGGTFAKYTTSDSATDTARVAKWGVEVLASGNLFGTEYNPNSVTDPDKPDQIGTVTTSVSSNGTDNIVAPGTKNDEGLTISITGTPEVSWAVEDATADSDKNNEIYLGQGNWGVMVLATGLNDASDVTGLYTRTGSAGEYTYAPATGDWVSGTEYYVLTDAVTVTAPYYPITWTVTATGEASAITDARLGDIMAAMETNFSTMSGTPNIAIDRSYKLTWAWEFVQDKNSDSVDDNAEDTILGHLMAGTEVVYSDGGQYKTVPTANKVATPAANTYWLENNVEFSMTVSQTN